MDHPLVKQADLELLATEKVLFFGTDVDWNLPYPPLELWPISKQERSFTEISCEFIGTFEHLVKDIEANS